VSPESLAAAILPPGSTPPASADGGASSHGSAPSPASNRKYLIVDVRTSDDFAKGHVVGSINIPLESFQPEALDSQLHSIIERHPESGVTVVFVSLRSPDLDEEAALTFASHAAVAFKGRDIVFTVLLGGLFLWFPQYGGDARLTASYNAAFWTPLLQRRTSQVLA
jgi:rhodanese-related sulfurtransferase